MGSLKNIAVGLFSLFLLGVGIVAVILLTFICLSVSDLLRIQYPMLLVPFGYLVITSVIFLMAWLMGRSIRRQSDGE